jgi:DNA-binding LacI/PurR family transcriptional regulator
MNRSDDIADALRGELTSGRYRAGNLLPSVDFLQTRFGCGEYSVRRALQQLRDEGLLSIRQHIGTVVTATRSRAWKGHVAFIHTSRRAAFFVSRLSVILGNRFEAAGWCYHPVFTAAAKDGQIDTEAIERHIANGLDFALVLSEFRQIAALLDRAGVPYAVLNGYARDFPNACGVIRDDLRQCFADLVAALKASGVSDVVEFDCERRMNRDFKNILFAAGIDSHRILLAWDNERPHSITDFRALGHSAITEFLADGHNRAHLPDVFLFTDDYLASGAIAALYEAGLRIPDDIRVVSFINRGDEPALGVTMARIENDPDAYGETVADYALDILAGRHPAPPRVPWRFIPGDSL